MEESVLFAVGGRGIAVFGRGLFLFLFGINFVFDVCDTNKGDYKPQEDRKNGGGATQEQEDIGKPIEPEGSGQNGKYRKCDKNDTDDKCNHIFLRDRPSGPALL